MSAYQKNWLWLFGLAAMILLAGLGLRDPWPADEPRFALIARDMAEGGHWLIPQIAGVLYPDKPPLFFWLVAALYKVTGSIRLAFLLPGVLAGLAVLALVTDLARRLWGRQVAIWCGATLLAIVQFPLQMKTGQIDALLCLWTTLAMYGFSRHLLLGPNWTWYAIGGFAAGLGIMTKGVGFIPYFAFIPYAYAAARKWPMPAIGWRDVRWLSAPLATLIAVGLWLVPMLIATSGAGDPQLTAYRDNILFHQTITRYADSWGHIRPAWYLFTNAAPWLWLPVTFLLPWLLPAWWKNIRRKNTEILVFGGWILLVLLFFSLSAGKRSVYIFPAVPALALVVGCHLPHLMRRTGVEIVAWSLPILTGLGMSVAAIYILMNPHDLSRWIVDISAIVIASGWLFALGVLLFSAGMIGLVKNKAWAFALSLIIFWGGAGTLIAPALNETRSGSAVIAAVRSEMGDESALGFVGWPESFLLQWASPAVHFGYRRDPRDEVRDALLWLAGSPAHRLLLPETRIEQCLDRAKLHPVGLAHRRNWFLADATALTSACPAGEPVQTVVLYEPFSTDLMPAVAPSRQASIDRDAVHHD